MQLLFLLLLLVAPYALLTLAGRRFGGPRFDAAARARVGLSLFFAFTGPGHFVRTEEMAAMLPPGTGTPKGTSASPPPLLKAERARRAFFRTCR